MFFWWSERKKSSDRSADEAGKIVLNWLCLVDKPMKADVIYILGGDRLEAVERAVELYEMGYASHIAFISTGGTFGGQRKFKKPEHEKYSEVLIEHGIPESAILAAGLSTNTLEEARKVIPFLKEHGINPKKMILCSRPVHQRRAYATFKKQNPGVDFINCPASEPFNATDELLSERMLQETERLVKYALQGDLVEQIFPTEVLGAIEIIRRG